MPTFIRSQLITITAVLTIASAAMAQASKSKNDDSIIASPPNPGIPVTIRVTHINKIWDRAPHNAFTDLLYWNKQFICAFREGRNHASTDGRIRVLASSDAQAWQSLALIKLDGYDLRDADLSIMPDGRIMLLGGAAPRERDGQRAPTGTFVSFSQDGREWTPPKVVIAPGRWLWRVTWHDGRAYGFSYPATDGNHLDLLTSDDGLHWTTRAANLLPGQGTSEVQIQFDQSGRALALVRRSNASALLGRSDGDYTHWQWSDLNCSQVWGRDKNPFGSEFRGFGGPNFIQTLHDVWIAAGRMHENGAHTALTYLDVKSATMQPLLKLPSAGDTSYPGLVWRDNTLYVSYYASHEGNTSIYLAKAKLKPTPHEHTFVAHDAGAGSYEAFPDITRLADGRLMCIFYAGYGHVSPPIEQYPRGGRIAYCLSDDDGRTWSQPRTLYDGPDDDRDPSITQLSTGELLCNFFMLGKGVHQLRSKDGGQTWSEPTLIAPPPYYVSSPARELSTGRLALGIYHHQRGDVHPAFIYSDDAGKTWSKPIDIDNAAGKPLSETDVIELADGTLYLIQRHNGRGDMHFATSNDQGKTWSASKPIDSYGQAPYLHRAPNGVILLGYRGPGEPNWGTYLRYSLDECKTWSDAIPIDTWANGAYPSMVNLNDDTVLIVYYDDKGYGHGRYRNMSNIRAKRLRITREGITILPTR